MTPSALESSGQAESNRLLVIMFTDLVNSTGLKEQIGHAAYRRLKTRHDELIGQALKAAPSGRVLQDNGDGYFLSFGSIADSVAMALMFQWLMAREPWPFPFQSRVGLHLGEVVEGRSQITGQADFTSSAIDLASRTMSLAMGGQILLTEPVYEAARAAIRQHPLPAGEIKSPTLQWRSHGPYQFKGATRPIEIFEVGAEGSAPLGAPADSEKARKYRGPALTRRAGLLAAGTLLFLGALIWGLLERKNPEVELRRQQIERQVLDLKSQPPQLSPTNAVASREVALVKPADLAGFEIQSDNRVIDLRDWKLVPADKVSEQFCGVTMNSRMHLKKVAPVNQFETVALTTGLDLFWNTGGEFPVAIEAQTGNDLVGGQQMKIRKLSLDVSSVKIGSEFDLQHTITYWNPLQSEEDQWFGVVGYDNAFAVSLLIIFPDDKPMKHYQLTVAPVGKNTTSPFAGPHIVLQGRAKEWVYWEIPEPKAGSVYRLKWTW